MRNSESKNVNERKEDREWMKERKVNNEREWKRIMELEEGSWGWFKEFLACDREWSSYGILLAISCLMGAPWMETNLGCVSTFSRQG